MGIFLNKAQRKASKALRRIRAHSGAQAAMNACR
jgi:hypothetical protein